ncbi:MAG TPA: outer membrane protein assembly factor BamA [Chromatiales bacterium]|nr:outer membrane protein assembly factor BamA [Chromatiales bacterium]
MASLLWLLVLAMLLGWGSVRAESFTVRDIQVEGVERIEPGTVFTYLPVKVGESFDTRRAPEVIRALYRTGFFSDVALYRRGDTLVVRVKERPAIAEITFDGNKDIKDEDLKKALETVGIAKGRVYNPSVLERLEQELRQQYFARGKYNVRIDVQTKTLPRNRVSIHIQIAEGKPARIRRISIVGNRAFDDDALKGRFKSGKKPWWNPFSTRNRYAKAKLAGDLEILRSYYLDRGYLRFEIASTEVSITPDNRDIYITIDVLEGQRYSVSDVRLAGEFPVPEEELSRLVAIHPGEIFSRRKVVKSIDNIQRRLGDEGYAFAKINPIPEVDDATRQVALTLFIDPGHRVYVRRIRFVGNQATRDVVFRRELRQMEGGWYSLSKIELSRQRLQRLSFVESAQFETRRVPGSDDLVDLEVKIKERKSGSFSIGIGYSQAQGVLFNLSLSEDNFLGTGKRVSARFDNSRVSQVYSLSYVNPYFTVDGISAGFNISYTSIDAEQANVSNYATDRFDVGFNTGIPLTEWDTLRAAIDTEWIRVKTRADTPQEILDFLDRNGDRYLNFPLVLSLIHDSRDRAIFATRGNRQRLSLEVTILGSDLEYYKVGYRYRQYIPLRNWLTGVVRTNVAYGNTYGDDGDLPFFEKYYAGGVRSVRGYRTNTLGPRDSRGDPFGGDFRTVGSVELVFPVPFIEKSENMRLSVFMDAGNVFARPGDWALGEIRASAGVAFAWVSPIGALKFSYALPINDQPGDKLEAFQFNVGTAF